MGKTWTEISSVNSSNVFSSFYSYPAAALALLKEVSVDVHVTDKKDRFILMATLMTTRFADALFYRVYTECIVGRYCSCLCYDVDIDITHILTAVLITDSK